MDRPKQTPRNFTITGDGESEKLISSSVILKQLNQKRHNPKPFSLGSGEPLPTKFQPPHEDNAGGYSTVRESKHPNNIQEIIGNVHQNFAQNIREAEFTRNLHPAKGMGKIKTTKNIRQKAPKDVEIVPQNLKKFEQKNIINSFKPRDPSDVNLMATGNLRFAPPAWSNFQKTRQNHVKEDAANVEINDPNKPLTMTLNLFPIANENGGYYNQGDYSFGDERENKFFRMMSEYMPRELIIKLNLFPPDEDVSHNDEIQERHLVDLQPR